MGDLLSYSPITAKLMHGVIEAGKLRLLVLSSGAGAASRHEIGTGVIGGMLFATFLGLLLIPVFYVPYDCSCGEKLDQLPLKRE